MLIRCQKCQAVFSLQDGVVASGARFKVECGRCLQVFEASAPTRAVVDPEAGRALQMPPAPAELAKALEPRSRRVQIAIAVVSGMAVVVAATQWRRFAGMPREAERRMEKARQKLLRDDLQSLEQAAALFSEAARITSGAAMPEAERAYAVLLQAATHKDLADRLEAAGRELNERNAKLRLDRPPGFEKQAAELTDQIAQTAQEREPHVRSANKLLQDGVAAAKAALEEDGEDPGALRAMALYCALANASERGLRYLDAAEKKGPPSEMNAYTRAALALSGAPSRERQDRALAALALARQAEPRLLRAQVDLGAISLDRQEPGPARAALSKVLEQNPQHERARRLLALLPAAP
jgi:predicted Zn finger-like uncharacterized protein